MNYIKKWWLETDIQDREGNVFEFKGWINTLHENKEDIPETITGNFFIYENEIGFHGGFLVDDNTITDSEHAETIGTEGEKYNFVVSAGIYKKSNLKWEDLNNTISLGAKMRLADKIMDNSYSVHVLFDKTYRKIEDCLVLDKTYVDKF